MPTADTSATIELTEDQIDAVAGGMTIQSGYRSADVIDGRGGSIDAMGYRFTIGADGTCTGAEPIK